MENQLSNESSLYERYGWVPLQKEAIMCNQIDAFLAISKDKVDAKEDSATSTVLRIAVFQKAPLGMNQHQTVKNQAHGLSCYELHLSKTSCQVGSLVSH